MIVTVEHDGLTMLFPSFHIARQSQRDSIEREKRNLLENCPESELAENNIESGRSASDSCPSKTT